MPRTLQRLLVVAAIALALDACRFGYGLGVGVDAGGQTSAGEGGDAPASSGDGGSATNAGSSSMAGAVDEAGAPAVGGAGGAASGSGGTGGGSAGKTGSGGTGGGSAGRSGSAGTGGAAGRSGSGGTGGSAGKSGSGAGGSAGTGGVDLVNLVVTTAADEADSAATPSSPGQTGFSLREAITFANGNAGYQSITFAAGLATMGLKSALPTVQESLDINGAAAILDASTNPSTSACLSVASSDVHIDGLEIHHCQGEPVLFSSSTSTGSQLTNAYLHDNKKAAVIYGDGAVISGNLIVFSAAAGLEIFGKNAQLQRNDVAASLGTNYLIHDGANGAYLLGNVSIGGGDGIGLGVITGITIWHSTIVDSVYAGLNVGTATQVDARNNIFIGADTYGVRGPDSAFSKLDHNLYFNNTSGDRNQGSLDATSVVGDPLFNDPANFDYALKVGSAAINKGFNLGVDRNATTSGLYNGSAPDIGWLEAP